MKRAQKPHVLPARLALLALLALPAGAQRSNREIRSDIEFARGLASEWQFVDMADDVIREIEDEGVSSKMAQELALVKCDIFSEGARHELDSKRRLELYDRAVSAYTRYIDEFPFVPEARRNFVDVSNAYARSMAAELEDAAGEEATLLRTRIDEVLTKAVRQAQELSQDVRNEKQALTEEGEDVPQDLIRAGNVLELNRGQMLLLLGDVSTDGTYYYAQAQKVLENLALEAGERSYFGLWAYMELGRVMAGSGDDQSAVDFFEFVFETAIPREPEKWGEVVEQASPAELDTRWRFAQLVVGDLLSTLTELGKTEEAVIWGLHFYNTWRREGFNMQRQGYEGVLAVARVMLDAGGAIGGQINSGELAWYETDQAAADAGHAVRMRRTALDLALSLAQQVNLENRGNVLQLRAQKLISEVITRPGADPEPSVLFEAAEGQYYNGEYEAAAAGFKRVLASLESRDEATRGEFGAKVYYDLGRTYRAQKRWLEAAVAFREGIDRYSADKLFAPDLAKGYLDMMKQVRRDVEGSEPRIDAEIRRAEQAVADNAGDEAGDIIFLQAQRRFDKKEYEAARAQFQEVTAETNSYEKALVYAAVSAAKAGDNGTGVRELESYVEDYVPDARNALSSETKKLRRQEALGMARFYLGQIAGKQKDYDGVIRWLDGFYADFPGQTDYGAVALYYVLNARLAQGDLEAAKAAHDKMLELFRDHDATGKGAFHIYTAYEKQREEAEAAGDTAKVAELTPTLAKYLHIRNELDDDPAYGSLRRESNHWMEIGDWARAEEVLRAIRRRYGDSTDPDIQPRLDGVASDLGEALVRQHKVQDAAEVLDPLIPDDPDDDTAPKPPGSTLRTYCLALSGWVEGDAENVVEVPGIGGAENLAVATQWWQKLTAVQGGRDKWVEPWYELKFLTAYAYYRWGQVDSSKLEIARQQIDTLKVETGNDFHLVTEGCGGDETLARRFAWLDRKLR